MFAIGTLALTCFSLAVPGDVSSKIDSIARATLAATGVPSASVAVVKEGRIAYVHAYGKAQLQPPRDADPGMRYAVGSISKQFTAAAILFLVQDGKLSLDDPVSKFFPDLTRANEVSIRMLLSHTSGYSDYWPEDYVMTDMMRPTTPQQIMDKWAKRPLDFDPGTKWQYSNTNYVIAGQIIEKLSGQPLMALLSERVFKPLGMKSVFDVDKGPLPEKDATGYYRHALGPLRRAPKEGAGWLSAAGELSMPAGDLALWDISLMNESLLKPTSYAEMFKEVHTKDGQGTHYGLGVAVRSENGHTYIAHSGEVSGFVADNSVAVDSKAAVVVLTNQDAVDAAASIAHQITPLLIGRTKPEDRALNIFTELQHGHLDRSQLTDFCNAYFSSEAIEDFQKSLQPLGAPLSLVQTREGSRGGMKFRSFRLHFADRNLTLTTYEMPDGKLEQYLITPAE